jgi:protein TonB
MTATLPARVPGENRFVAIGVAASVVLHAVVLLLAPRFVDDEPFEPPRVLSVVLAEPAEPAPLVVPEPPAPAVPEVTAPVTPPPQPVRRAPARPAPRLAEPPEPVRPSPAPPVAAAPAEAPASSPARDAGLKEERPVAGPPAPVVATAPREPLTPPDFRAAYLRNPPPGYPAAARRNGEEGTVTLRVLVSVEGAPRDVLLERSSGSGLLDAAALAAVKNWRFAPARRGGEAQEAWVLVPIVFRLEPRS